MAGEHGKPHTPDDALLASLYLRAEEVGLLHERPYDVEEGALRFSAWLDDSAARTPASTLQGGVTSGTGLADAQRDRPPVLRNLVARRWRWRRSAGNLLVLACGADHQRLGSGAERQRYVTMGALMVLTTVQAFYCGASVAVMTSGRPLLYGIGYGLFLAGSVFFIDRSIVGYVAPRRPGDSRSKEPKHSRWAIGARIVVAMAASVLLAEVLLLQVFAQRINVQLASDNQSSQLSATSQVNRVYAAQIDPLLNQINRAQRNADFLSRRVLADTRKVQCEEFGCSGIPAGTGPGFRSALSILRLDRTNLAAARREQLQITRQNNAKIAALESRKQATIQQSTRVTGASRDVLAREQAFWTLTVKYPEVAFVRILLTLLLLSVDLAPVIVKVTSSYGVYEENLRSEMLEAHLRTEADAELLERRIRIEAEVRRARQELERDLELDLLDDQRRRRPPPPTGVNRDSYYPKGGSAVVRVASAGRSSCWRVVPARSAFLRLADMADADHSDRMPRARRAVTACSGTPAPRDASRVSGEPIAADRSRHADHHHDIVNIAGITVGPARLLRAHLE